MRFRFLYTCAFALLPHVTSAIQLEECARSIDGHHFGEGEHYDAGSGMVVYTNWATTGLGSVEFYTVSDCSSGQQFKIWSYRTEYDSDGAEIVNYDDRATFAAKLAEITTSENSYRFEDLRSEFQVPEDRVAYHSSSNENCACHSLYPDLVNNKQRFQMEPWNE